MMPLLGPAQAHMPLTMGGQPLQPELAKELKEGAPQEQFAHGPVAPRAIAPLPGQKGHA